MSGPSQARVKNWPNTPAVAATTPGCEATQDADSLEIDEAGIELLIEFFLQLRKWDKLQSIRTSSEVKESVKEIAA